MEGCQFTDGEYYVAAEEAKGRAQRRRKRRGAWVQCGSRNLKVELSMSLSGGTDDWEWKRDRLRSPDKNVPSRRTDAERVF